MTTSRQKKRSVLPLLQVISISLISSVATASEPTADQLAFFENEIRPLLIKHCYECHGDGGHAEGELFLNSHQGVIVGGASGPAAIAGKAKESLLIRAVEYRGIEMPPNGKLPQSEIDKLNRWVEMGIPWPQGENDPAAPPAVSKKFEPTQEHLEHWAFQPITSPTPPEVARTDWSGNPIDRFLLASMQKQGIEPNGPATRGVLLRRVTYDLTGLPPTPEELNAFLADESSDAWEKVIDRLLASPHYGERWGRHWLDVARYADTAGDASDYPVPDAYKYRNYVINSFNNDKPYDRFLIEQYAGDLLAADAPPEQYEELITATTHLALSRRFGYNDTNFLYFHLTIQDLLDTMGQSVLGLSVGCARCHDHKFEPISASDYYALYGIFSSSKFTFPGAEEVRAPKDLVPAIPPEKAVELQKLREEQVAAQNQKIRDLLSFVANFQGGFESTDKLPPDWGSDPQAVVVTGSSSPFLNVAAVGNRALQLPNDPRNLGVRRPIGVFTPESEEPLFINVDFRNVNAEAGGDGYYRVALDHPENGFSPAVEVFVNAHHVAIRRDGAFAEVAPLTMGEWYNLQLVVNWKSKNFSGVVTGPKESWSFEDAPFNPSWDGIANSWVIDGHGTDSTLHRPQRELDNFWVQNEPLLSAREVNPVTAETFAGQIAETQGKVAELRKSLDELNSVPSFPTVYGVREGTVENARMQMRGEPDRLGDEVPRGYIEILGGEKFPENYPGSGRLLLAKWLTAPENPLTDRVIVNRIWQYHFGQAIVSTPNDFGVRGARPTHPELLDFLATKFRESGHSFKAMHRLILTSRAYQVSSDNVSSANEIDPTNIWFWRRNNQRMDAESLRDTWLTLSGELDDSMGGSHPFPPIPQWGFSQHNPFDAVYDSNKRTVYLMTQRIKRHPFLALFDGADPNASTGKRESTTTPSQALFMMNDPSMHQRSYQFALRLTQESSEKPEQITRLYQMALSRVPTDEEIRRAERFCESYAQNLPADADRPNLSLAAYVRVILSSNEFLYLK
ncbi:PSD1 and planctomycete cytochrome C domain-containing protein [Planctomicrobium sp. SH668]|uniref:PSD1 and planctomycete cytochrome C domain-containing protein n=1 Tax=Planctomicrobium sp. SH668 TaxID=3448126 RepID=UPI003F5BE8B6